MSNFFRFKNLLLVLSRVCFIYLAAIDDAIVVDGHIIVIYKYIFKQNRL